MFMKGFLKGTVIFLPPTLLNNPIVSSMSRAASRCNRNVCEAGGATASPVQSGLWEGIAEPSRATNYSKKVWVS